MPVFDMTEENFLSHPNWDVFTFGVPPVAIDLMVSVKGLEFDTCYKKSVVFEHDHLKIGTIIKMTLLKQKNHPGVQRIWTILKTWFNKVIRTQKQ